MFNTQIDAIVPMLCVTLAALAAMGAEAFRRPGERMPIGGLGIVGLCRRGRVRGAAVEPQCRRLRRHRRRQLRAVRHDRAGDRRRADDHVLVAGASNATAFPQGEYYALVLFSHRRHDHDGDRERPAGRVHRARDPVARGLRADRHPARQPAGTEAAFKYFLLGAFSSAFFLYGIAFTYGLTGSTRLAASERFCRGAVDERQPDDPAGARPAARRLRVQDLGRAVPHVDAGRV